MIREVRVTSGLNSPSTFELELTTDQPGEALVVLDDKGQIVQTQNQGLAFSSLRLYTLSPGSDWVETTVGRVRLFMPKHIAAQPADLAWRMKAMDLNLHMTAPLDAKHFQEALYKTFRNVMPVPEPRVEPEPLPVRQQAEPIRGYKRARLVMTSGKLRFGAVSWDKMTYDVDAVAQCKSAYLLPHPIPDPTNHRCCGFYAAATPEWRTKLREDYGDKAVADLDVELYGRVIHYEHGFRAERQRVLSVRIDQRCWSCSAEDPAGMAFWRDAVLVPYCINCWPHPLSLAEVANMLGTEVSWGSSS